MASQPIGNPYRFVCTPSLHRRFTGAATIALLICYIEAVCIGDKSSYFWFWFPAGPAGIRTSLLSISVISIFVLRIGQLHFGTRTTTSPSETFRKYLLRVDTAWTIGWYLFSAWWFSEVYMWSVPASANLSWVTGGKAWERRSLNEKPIYLRSVFYMLASIQAVLRLAMDYDKVNLRLTSAEVRSGSQWVRTVKDTSLQLWALSPSLLKSIGLRAAGVSLFGPLIYAMFIRRTAWTISLYAAEFLWDIPPSQLSYIPPYHVSLIFRSFTSGALLLTLWETSNVLFSSYLAQPPLKENRPLTAEANDPNGCLLNGLQSKRDVARTFAFSELAYITQNLEPRRKTFYLDIDRPTGSVWTQLMTLCLGNILAITNRILDYQNPTATSAPPQRKVTIETLPSISSKALKQDNIFSKSPTPANRREKIESSVGTMAKSYGQSPQPAQPLKFLENQRIESQKYIGAAGQKLLTQGQQEALSKDSLLTQYNEYLMRFLRTPIGSPFRLTFKRRVCAVVLGSPYSELNIILYSINSLGTLAVMSIQEDPYGRVAKDIPLLVRAYVSTVSSIEAFVSTLPPHWTDVEFSDSDRRVEEVDLITTSLKAGLKQIVTTFAPYASELGLSAEEVRTAKKVAGIEVDD